MTRLRCRATGLRLAISNAYGLCTSPDKALFLANIVATTGEVLEPCSVMGDFNLIRQPHEKSNGKFCVAGTKSFNDCIDEAALLELPFLNRLFTWSNC